MGIKSHLPFTRSIKNLKKDASSILMLTLWWRGERQLTIFNCAISDLFFKFHFYASDGIIADKLSSTICEDVGVNLELGIFQFEIQRALI